MILLFPFRFDINASVVVLTVLVACAIGAAALYYQKTIPEISRRKRILLGILRALGITAILLALCEPILTFVKTDFITPSLAVLIDDSESMSITDGAGSRRTERVQALEAFSGTNSLYPIAFGADAPRELSSLGDSLPARGSETNIARAFDFLRKHSRERTLAATILVSDGNVTAGSDPVRAAEALGIPVFTIGIGDTAERRDAAVRSIQTDEPATVGQLHTVAVNVHTEKLRGETVTLDFTVDGTPAGSQSRTVTQDASDEVFVFSFTPHTVGTAKLSATIHDIAGEVTTRNNTKLHFLRVERGGMHILLVAGAPSADVSFARQILEQDSTNIVRMCIQKDASSFYIRPTASMIDSADVLLLVGFPVSSSPADVLSLLRDHIEVKSLPILFLPSRTLDVELARKYFEKFLPFTLARGASNERLLGVAATTIGATHAITHVTTDIASAYHNLPPVFATENIFRLRTGAEGLLVNELSSTENIFALQSLGRLRSAAFSVYGLWRWRLMGDGSLLARDATPVSIYDHVITTTVRWLAHRSSRAVKIEPVRKIFSAGEGVEFRADVNDEAALPVEDADVQLELRSHDNAGRRTLSLASLLNGKYSTRIEGLPAGEYYYRGDARRGNTVLGADSGRFVIGEYNPEYDRLSMNASLLKEIASRTGGKFITVATAKNVIDSLRNSAAFTPTPVDRSIDTELWNSWPLLVFALAMFGTEWFIRKRNGLL